MDKIKYFILNYYYEKKYLKSLINKSYLLIKMILWISLILNISIIMSIIQKDKIINEVYISLLITIVTSLLLLIKNDLYESTKSKIFNSISLDDLKNKCTGKDIICFEYFKYNKIDNNFILNNLEFTKNLFLDKEYLYDLININMVEKSLIYILENKEKIEFLFENKEWIFKIYIGLDIDKKFEFLKNQEFIYYIKDIPENIKFDYLKNTIYEIENNNLVDYYSIISELFVNIDDKELNNIKYKHQILLEKKELCSNKIISL